MLSHYKSSFSRHAEFLKVADELNIDDIVSIASWDNITTKGTFSKIPKKFLFGMKMKSDVLLFHDNITPNQVEVTGTGIFDQNF